MITPRILLIGRSGQIGNDLSRLLPALGTVVAPGRDTLDLSKPAQIREVIAETRPDLIVNAAAYTAVDQAESDQAAARAINSEAPGVIAEEAKKLGAFVVHYSTDYVFDGAKSSPYEEGDPTNPLNVYGKTKLEGERAIRNSGADYLVLRTSWVYTTRGRNFLLTILRLASQREELRIVQDQVGAPTWSREIASATVRILEQQVHQERAGSIPEARRTYHLTAGGETNWCDFAKAILEEAGALPEDDPWLAVATNERPLVARRVAPITTLEYPTAARRPAYSVLSNSLLSRTFRFMLPDWRTQLKSAFVHRKE